MVYPRKYLSKLPKPYPKHIKATPTQSRWKYGRRVTATATRSERLQLYGLYKQATLGDERPERPGKFNLEARLKWDAWAAEEGLSKEEARKQYCDLAKQLVGEPVEGIVEE